eukprot:SAG22_NODE_276_length_13167_cov_8.415825_14_plen_258_part_00
MLTAMLGQMQRTHGTVPVAALQDLTKSMFYVLHNDNDTERCAGLMQPAEVITALASLLDRADDSFILVNCLRSIGAAFSIEVEAQTYSSTDSSTAMDHSSRVSIGRMMRLKAHSDLRVQLTSQVLQYQMCKNHFSQGDRISALTNGDMELMRGGLETWSALHPEGFDFAPAGATCQVPVFAEPSRGARQVGWLVLEQLPRGKIALASGSSPMGDFLQLHAAILLSCSEVRAGTGWVRNPDRSEAFNVSRGACRAILI